MFDPQTLCLRVISLRGAMRLDAAELNKRKTALGREVMSISAGTLLLNMSFMAKAVNKLAMQPYEGTFECDGRVVRFSPDFMLKRYRKNERLPVHDLLHILLHCIFRHYSIGAEIERLRWDAACDIAAESMIMEIGREFCSNERIAEKGAVLLELSSKVKPMTAERLYHYFGTVDEEKLREYCSVFLTDDHSVWYKRYEEKELEPEEDYPMISPEIKKGEDKQNNEAEEEQERSGGENSEEEQEHKKDGDDAEGQETEPENTEGEAETDEDISLDEWLEQQLGNDREQLDKMWKDISEEIRSQLESYGSKAGEDSQFLSQTISEVNRERCDYSAFLRRFAVSGEIMRPDLDSFDRSFYSYGLSEYGNVALIEPLEYREVKLVKNFVIAIDTSGSVSGKLVEKFMQKTYNILKSEESFFTKVNIYVIQCDTEVKDAALITCQEDFDRYMEKLELKGLGGTDLRPVFDYVDMLIEKGKLTDLKGMIYFTDGQGEFPPKKPKYDTAFAFIRSYYDRSEPPAVPPWAIKLILEEEDIING